MYDIPDAVRFADKDTRIRWWRAKVIREEPVFMFLDELDTEQEPQAIRQELSQARESIGVLESEITTICGRLGRDPQEFLA